MQTYRMWYDNGAAVLIEAETEESARAEAREAPRNAR